VTPDIVLRDEIGLCRKTIFQAKQFFKLRKIVFSALFFETQTSPALQENNFSGSFQMFFPHCSFATQRSSALQKNNFSDSKKSFFVHKPDKIHTSLALQKNTIFQA